MATGDVLLTFSVEDLGDVEVGSLATVENVANALGKDVGDLTANESLQIEFLLTLATGIIAAAGGKTEAWAETLSPIPKVLRLVAIQVVLRAMANPEGLAAMSEQIGAYSVNRSYRAASAGGSTLMLTAAEKRMVRAAVAASDLTSVTLESPYSGTVADDESELDL